MIRYISIYKYTCRSYGFTCTTNSTLQYCSLYIYTCTCVVHVHTLRHKEWIDQPIGFRIWFWLSLRAPPNFDGLSSFCPKRALKRPYLICPYLSHRRWDAMVNDENRGFHPFNIFNNSQCHSPVTISQQKIDANILSVKPFTIIIIARPYEAVGNLGNLESVPIGHLVP